MLLRVHLFNDFIINTFAFHVSEMNPFDILDDATVGTVLKNDKGSTVKLVSWKLNNNLVEPGDSVASSITSIEVTYEKDNENVEAFYVAKINPIRDALGWSICLTNIFTHEISFFKILNEMNTFLESDNLHVPKCFYSSLAPGKELMICNDLRQDGYARYNRKIGLSFEHGLLIMKELAKLHASGFLLLNKYSYDTLIEKYPILKEEFFVSNNPDLEIARESVAKFFENYTNITLAVIESFPERKEVANWIKSTKLSIMKIISDNIVNCPDNLRVIAHGDCWNNNLLFK